MAPGGASTFSPCHLLRASSQLHLLRVPFGYRWMKRTDEKGAPPKGGGMSTASSARGRDFKAFPGVARLIP